MFREWVGHDYGDDDLCAYSRPWPSCHVHRPVAAVRYYPLPLPLHVLLHRFQHLHVIKGPSTDGDEDRRQGCRACVGVCGSGGNGRVRSGGEEEGVEEEEGSRPSRRAWLCRCARPCGRRPAAFSSCRRVCHGCRDPCLLVIAMVLVMLDHVHRVASSLWWLHLLAARRSRRPRRRSVFCSASWPLSHLWAGPWPAGSGGVAFWSTSSALC